MDNEQTLDVTSNAQPISESTYPSSLKESLNGKEYSTSTFDIVISQKSATGENTVIHNFPNGITVTIKYNIKPGYSYIVLHQDINGTTEVLPSTIGKNSITFTTTKLSPISVLEVKDSGTNPASPSVQPQTPSTQPHPSDKPQQKPAQKSEQKTATKQVKAPEKKEANNKVPKTADTTNMPLYALGILSGAALLVAGFKKRQK